MKKNRFGIIRITATILATAGMVLLSGCNKNTNAGGEGTNYPFTWQEKNNGTIVVKVDGSYAPGYFWSTSSGDDNVVTVDVKKNEKNGIATYIIKPVSEGITTVEFVRKKGENKINIDYSGKPAEEIKTSEVKEDSGDDIPTEAPSEFFTEEELEEMNESSKQYFENMVSDDVVCRILFDVQVSTVKKGKLKAAATPSGVSELEGTQIGAEGEISFEYWKESDTQVFLRITDVEETWFMKRESVYVPQETEEIVGYVPAGPVEDEDGNEQIFEAYEYGFTDGQMVYAINGVCPGNATLTLAAPLHSQRFVMRMTISAGGAITVDDARVESYTPTAEEIQDAKWERPSEDIETEESSSETSESENVEDGQDAEGSKEAEQQVS